MNCLLDTHTFIWTISNPDKLSKLAKDIIVNRDNDIFVSVISFWEIALKTSIKKFIFEGINVKEFPENAKEMNFHFLDLTSRECSTITDLPLMDNHKDPFDRMIIWQSITQNMKLISNDSFFMQYRKFELQLVW